MLFPVRNTRSEFGSSPRIMSRESNPTATTSKLVTRIWPMMQDTLNNIVRSVTAGANMVKNMLSKKVVPMKISPLKNKHKPVSFSSPISIKSTNPPKFVEPTIQKKPLHEPVFMEHDLHHLFSSHHEHKPSYLLHPIETKTHYNSKNLQDDMGIKRFKNFEDTVLRKLEKEEEIKFEATMHTFHYNPKNKLTDDRIINKNNQQEEWKPISQKKTPKHKKKKPHTVSELNTNIHGSYYHNGDNISDEKITYEETVEKPVTALPETNHQTKQSKTDKNSPFVKNKKSTAAATIKSSNMDSYSEPFLAESRPRAFESNKNLQRTPTQIPANLSNFIINRNLNQLKFPNGTSIEEKKSTNFSNISGEHLSSDFRAAFNKVPVKLESDIIIEHEHINKYKDKISHSKHKDQLKRNNRGNVKFGS